MIIVLNKKTIGLNIVKPKSSWSVFECLEWCSCCLAWDEFKARISTTENEAWGRRLFGQECAEINEIPYQMGGENVQGVAKFERDKICERGRSGFSSRFRHGWKFGDAHYRNERTFFKLLVNEICAGSMQSWWGAIPI